MTYNCKKFCGNTAEIICSRCAIKEATDEQLLEILGAKIAKQEIRSDANHDYLYLT